MSRVTQRREKWSEHVEDDVCSKFTWCGLREGDLAVVLAGSRCCGGNSSPVGMQGVPAVHQLDAKLLLDGSHHSLQVLRLALPHNSCLRISQDSTYMRRHTRYCCVASTAVSN